MEKQHLTTLLQQALRVYESTLQTISTEQAEKQRAAQILITIQKTRLSAHDLLQRVGATKEVQVAVAAPSRLFGGRTSREAMTQAQVQVQAANAELENAYLRLAQAFLANKQWSQARKLVEPLMNSGSSLHHHARVIFRQLHLGAAQESIQQENWPSARQWLNQWLLVDRNDREFRELLCETYLQPADQAFHQQDWNSVRSNLNELLKVYGSHELAQDLLRQSHLIPASTALRDKRWEEARAIAQLWLKTRGNDSEFQDLVRQSYLIPASAALEDKRWEEARALARLWLTTRGNDSEFQDLVYETFYQPASDASEAGNWETTRSLLQELLKINTQHQQARDLLRQSYWVPAQKEFEEENWQETRNLVEQALRFFPNDHKFVDLLCQTYYRPASQAFQKEDWETVRRTLEDLLGVDKKHQPAQDLLRQSYWVPAQNALQEGDWVEARKIARLWVTEQRLRASGFYDLDRLRTLDVQPIFGTDGRPYVDTWWKNLDDDFLNLLCEAYYRPAVKSLASEGWKKAASDVYHLSSIKTGYKDIQQLVEQYPQVIWFCGQYPPGHQPYQLRDSYRGHSVSRGVILTIDSQSQDKGRGYNVSTFDEPGRVIHNIRCPGRYQSDLWDCLFSDDGEWLALTCKKDDRVVVLSSTTRMPVRSFKLEPDPKASRYHRSNVGKPLRFTVDNQWFIHGMYTNSIRSIRSATTGKRHPICKSLGATIHEELSSTGRWLIVQTETGTFLFSTRTQQQKFKFLPRTSISISQDDEFLATWNSDLWSTEPLCFWSLRTFDKLKTFGNASSVTFLDNQKAAIWSESFLQIVSLQDCQILATLHPRKDWRISQDGQWLADWSDSRGSHGRLWSLQTFEEIHAPPGSGVNWTFPVNNNGLDWPSWWNYWLFGDGAFLLETSKTRRLSYESTREFSQNLEFRVDATGTYLSVYSRHDLVV